ncbi:MAG: hypothetical protein JRH07_04295 [Deltaproteobacteria bacterium]|nr:hypothetical protein [Deltaproteobacteria bacterium]MBW2121049.1 hypothetical protein [Deltaproteobacteria bacterium]
MEVLEKGKTISIHSGQGFPALKVIEEAGIVLLLIWGVFAVLVLFFSQPGREILPYFIALALLLVLPVVFTVLIRESRYWGTILFDGERRVLSLRGVWRSREVPFDAIKSFQVNRYPFRKGVFLHRLEVVLSSGQILRLIRDVPEREALSLLCKRIQRLVETSPRGSG